MFVVRWKSQQKSGWWKDLYYGDMDVTIIHSRYEHLKELAEKHPDSYKDVETNYNLETFEIEY